MDDRALQQRVARLDGLLQAVEALPDPAARATATEAVQSLLELYGEGLARVMASAAQAGGGDLIDVLAADELVSHLLLLHGLHPVDVETRVRRALAAVRPYLESHGGNVELRGVEAGVARIRLQGSCNGCPSSAQTLKLAIEQAIQQAAPDLEGIEAEGVAEPRPYAIPLTAGPVAAAAPPRDRPSSWSTTDVLQRLAVGDLLLEEIAGEPVLLLKLDGDCYAYRSSCPACHGSLARGVLQGAALTCAGCGHRYDVRRAGRCLDAPSLHLEPIPLLVGEGGQLRLAMPSAVSGRS